MLLYVLGLIIEDITEEVECDLSKKNVTSSSEASVTQARERSEHSRVRDESCTDKSTSNSEYLQALKDDPDAIR